MLRTVARHFCTLFDQNYLPRGLALYQSLVRLEVDFRLRVFSMDEMTASVLRRMQLPALEVVALEELEEIDQQLRSVKGSRSPVEYCWSATPSACAASLTLDPDISEITYLDADLKFYADPAMLFDEIGGSSTAIVPHRYARRWRYYESESGIYNVSWLTFRRDRDGLEALGWWRDRCLEWCYARADDGKFGDQKYLDDWPTRFSGVHVLEHPGAGVAPWNVESVNVWRDPVGGDIRVDDVPLVFFHHHALQLLGKRAMLRLAGRAVGAYEVTPAGTGDVTWRSGYPMSGDVRELVWEPYLRDLRAAYDAVRAVEPGFDFGFVRPDARQIASVARSRARRIPHRIRAELARNRASLGWNDVQVVDQMTRLSEEELRLEPPVKPFQVFITAITELLSRVELADGTPFLDFGCGVGGYSEMLRRRFDGRFSYEGWDASPAVIEAARRAHPGAVFRVASLLDDPIPHRFDVVLASALLDVIPQFELALDTLLAARAPHILLHRQRIATDATRVERAPGYGGQTTSRSFVTYSDLDAAARRHGRRVVAKYHVSEDVHSFLLERVADAA